MRLTKHHGLGNDFLVHVDPQGPGPTTAELARAVCDRRTGIGADGLLTVTPGAGPDHVRMALHNADGGRAEMSGNGISCLAQAVVRADLVEGPAIRVATDVGERTVEVRPTDDALTHLATVDFGAVKAGVEAPEWLGDGVQAARFADAGNPHLVLHAPSADDGPDLVSVGERANRTVPGGINVEVIRRTPAGLHLDVYERGAGITRACGTGAAAAAVVASDWGLVDDRVDVAMPGGTAHLVLGDTVTMTVPVTAVAEIDYLKA